MLHGIADFVPYIVLLCGVALTHSLLLDKAYQIRTTVIKVGVPTVVLRTITLRKMVQDAQEDIP